MNKLGRIVHTLVNTVVSIILLLKIILDIFIYGVSLKAKIWWYNRRYKSKFRKTLLKNKLPDKLVNDLTEIYVEFLDYIGKRMYSYHIESKPAWRNHGF